MRRFNHKGFGIGVLLLAGFSLAVMLLWNALMPAIFGLGAVDFFQAAGLLILSRLLLGGLGHMAGLGMGLGMHKRWMNMSQEDRDEFIKRRMGRFHGDQKTEYPAPGKSE